MYFQFQYHIKVFHEYSRINILNTEPPAPSRSFRPLGVARESEQVI